MNRTLDDDDLDLFVDALVRRLASFDRETLAAAKAQINRFGTPTEAKFFWSAVAQAVGREPEEVAKAVLFLASDDFRTSNRSSRMVDGGFTGAPFGAPIFQDGFRPLGGEAKLAKAHAEGDPQ